MRTAVLVLVFGVGVCGAGACSGDHAAAVDAPGNATDPDGPPAPCMTTISYGDTWIHGAQHPGMTDIVASAVTWDGTCVDDGANSYALLSNGFKPYFTGHGGCELALDHGASCGLPSTCSTRVRYGASWLAPAAHTAQYDDLPGRVFWDRACKPSGADSFGDLSNGFAPHFMGASACAMSFLWQECGGLYANPVIPIDCPDPGVVRDGARYILSCTSGNAGNAFPLYVSTDLVTWTPQGHIFPAGSKPAWAVSDFWAPEIHPVGTHWVAYFSARHTDGKLSIGAASATDPLGPYVPLPQPLIHDTGIGLIDVNELTTGDGKPYLLWKEDGNAIGQPTPIHGRMLAADGLSLTGATATLITNDQSWEGALVEAPFLVERAGMFYLFYSGNAYSDGRYAIGVARASSPLGPYTKAPAPIVVTDTAWVGPGHGSVVDGPGAETYLVYHAWRAGHVNGPGDGRVVLTDQVVWRAGWPAVPGGPSSSTRPLP